MTNIGKITDEDPHAGLLPVGPPTHVVVSLEEFNRNTAIRDAAIELLRNALFFHDCLTDSEDALREAIGISIEELRGGA